MCCILGVGQSLVYLPITVSVSLYFKKYLGIAMGFLTAGYALSKLVMTPLCQFLLETYGCRGTLFIMGAFMLHICVGGALCHPAHWHSKLIQQPQAASADNENVHQKECCPLQRFEENSEPTDLPDEIQMKSTQDTLSETVIHSSSLNSVNHCFSSSRHIDNFDGAAESLTKNSITSERNKRRSWLRSNKLMSSLDFTLLNEKLFYLVATQGSLLIVTMVYVSTYVFPFGIEAGLLPMEAAGLVSTRSLCELVGRLAGPAMLSLLKLPTRLTFMCSVFLHGIFIIGKFYFFF